mgnify:CR=1
MLHGTRSPPFGWKGSSEETENECAERELKGERGVTSIKKQRSTMNASEPVAFDGEKKDGIINYSGYGELSLLSFTSENTQA